MKVSNNAQSQIWITGTSTRLISATEAPRLQLLKDQATKYQAYYYVRATHTLCSSHTYMLPTRLEKSPPTNWPHSKPVCCEWSIDIPACTDKYNWKASLLVVEWQAHTSSYDHICMYDELDSKVCATGIRSGHSLRTKRDISKPIHHLFVVLR